MNWALLPSASKAIFPVIACHCNRDGKAFPGQIRLAILSGLSSKQVSRGIKGLKAFPDIKIKRSIPNEYFVKLPKEPIKGKTFPFYQVVLEYGLWRELSPAAKALYPVMRCFSYFDIDVYLEIEADERDHTDFEEIFANREYDFCNASKIELSKYAGIHRNSVESALKSLNENFLVEWHKGFRLWKIYRKSKGKTYWKRDFLNQKITKSFRYTIN